MLSLLTCPMSSIVNISDRFIQAKEFLINLKLSVRQQLKRFPLGNARRFIRLDVIGVLRLLLVALLLGSGWIVYQRLPRRQATMPPIVNTPKETTLQIVLRRLPPDSSSTANLPVQLYSIDLNAVRHEFEIERRAGLQPEDFIKQRMNKRPPVSARIDESGQATVAVSPGKWWIHVTLTGKQELSWRLPVNISGHSQTVELAPENAYMSERRF